MKPIKKTEMVKALFFNEIDNTVRKPEEKFINFGESVAFKKIEKNKDVVYEYNSLGFRSDEFTKTHQGKHVLFSGCSETEGVGGALESCWSYMTYKELQKQEALSGFFNLSRYGWGYDIIISNIMEYIKEYGKPDKIFILFPNIGRYYQWKDDPDDSCEKFHYVGAIPNSVKELGTEPEFKRKITIETQRSNFITFTMIIKLFEEYCKTNNIDLVWSSWDNEDATNYQNLEIFNSFIKMVRADDFVNDNQDLFLNKIKIKDDWERKRDGHSGYLFHYVWSQNFLGLIDKKPDK